MREGIICCSSWTRHEAPGRVVDEKITLLAKQKVEQAEVESVTSQSPKSLFPVPDPNK